MFQRLQIRHKLLAVLLLPLLALTALTAVQVRRDITAARRAEQVTGLATFAGQVTALVHDLQAERDSSLGHLAGGGDSGLGDLASLRDSSDSSIAALRSGLRDVDLRGYDPLLRGRLDHARGVLGQLDDKRRLVDGGSPDAAVAAQRYYGEVIAVLLDFDGGIASRTEDRRTARAAAAMALLSRLKELASQERGLLDGALPSGRFAAGQFQQLAAVIGMQDLLAGQFQAAAGPELRAFYSAQLNGVDLAKLAELRRAVLEAGPGGRIQAQGLGAAGGADGARELLTDRINRLRTVELRLGGELVESSRARQAAALRSALVFGSLALLVLLLAVVVSLLVGRSMARPLLRLRDVADQLAGRQLPEVVERLQRGETTHLGAGAAPIAATSSDETGQVARALDAANQMAVRVAAEQAALRMSIRDMFLNLAQRSQDLADRQLRLIDQLERDAEPDALEQLFKLDHLATRMRRYAESLIVLAGAEPPRRWSQPVLLGEIVRGSMSEVQDYQRVELLPIGDVGVSGHAVADVAHLLAELIENATSFSPPGTTVRITGYEAAGGFVLEIEDRGLGMSDEELVEANQRLTNPPAISLGLSRTLGLYVVGRLARRHGIEVQLRHSWYGGVTATVLLPRDLTTWLQRPEIAPPSPEELPDPDLPVADVPVFEQVMPEWFDAAAETGAEAGATAETGPPAATAPPPPPAPAPPPPAPPPPPPRPTPTPGQVTHNGLPRRVPRANLAPGIVAQRGEATGRPEARSPTLPSRSPEEIRSMLSSYRSGLERGRQTAAGQQEPGESDPPAPRSDDDSAQ